VGFLVALLLVGVGALAFWLSSRDTDPSAQPQPQPIDSGPSPSPSADPTAVAARVESQRTVTIDGSVVTVDETSTVVDGGAARATPPTGAPAGLELLGASVQTADGRSVPFDSSVKLQPSGSLTVIGRYRLTDCPDLLPTQWPSPSEFPDATRTYPRLEEPLHTAYAICPRSESKAKPLDGLTGTLADADVPTVKLKWSGSSQLTITTLGAASGVAVLVTEPGCNRGCPAEIPPGAEVAIAMQPVDPCPPADDDDTLTLKLGGGELVAVNVPGLHRAICG
jgi:hypothetical protein